MKSRVNDYAEKYFKICRTLIEYERALKQIKKWTFPLQSSHPFKAIFQLCFNTLSPETYPDNNPNEKPIKRGLKPITQTDGNKRRGKPHRKGPRRKSLARDGGLPQG